MDWPTNRHLNPSSHGASVAKTTRLIWYMWKLDYNSRAFTVKPAGSMRITPQNLDRTNKLDVVIHWYHLLVHQKIGHEGGAYPLWSINVLSNLKLDYKVFCLYIFIWKSAPILYFLYLWSTNYVTIYPLNVAVSCVLSADSVMKVLWEKFRGSSKTARSSLGDHSQQILWKFSYHFSLKYSIWLWTLWISVGKGKLWQLWITDAKWMFRGPSKVIFWGAWISIKTMPDSFEPEC